MFSKLTMFTRKVLNQNLFFFSFSCRLYTQCFSMITFMTVIVIDLEKKKIKRVTIKTDAFLKEEREADEQVKEAIPGYEGRTFNKILNSESNILFVDSNFIKAQLIESNELIKTTWDFTIDLSKNTVDLSMEMFFKETLKKTIIYAKYKCYRK